MIDLLRVDNRLIHGQVVESWLPELGVRRVLVADDEAAQSPLVRAAMGLAVPGNVEVVIQPLQGMDFATLAQDPVKSLLLVREVGGAVTAVARGVGPAKVQLGNVHFVSGRKQLTASVFLSPTELAQLKMLAEQGCTIEARAVPGEKPLTLAAIEEKLQD